MYAYMCIICMCICVCTHLYVCGGHGGPGLRLRARVGHGVGADLRPRVAAPPVVPVKLTWSFLRNHNNLKHSVCLYVFSAIFVTPAKRHSRWYL